MAMALRRDVPLSPPRTRRTLLAGAWRPRHPRIRRKTGEAGFQPAPAFPLRFAPPTPQARAKSPPPRSHLPALRARRVLGEPTPVIPARNTPPLRPPHAPPRERDAFYDAQQHARREKGVEGEAEGEHP
jgi:hypothetical protein